MGKYAVVWIIGALSLTSFYCVGQTAAIDSLKQLVSVQKDNTQKLELLIKLGEYHQSINKDSLYAYAILAKSLVVKNKKYKTPADIILINAYLRNGNTDSALVITEANLLLNPVSDPATRSLYFTLAALKADCYGDAANYKDALTTLYKIINEAEQYRDSLVLAKNISTLGVINYNLDHVPEAFNWYFKGISFTNNSPRFNAVAAVLYINLAETYRWVKQKDSAEYYINKAISLCQQAGNLFFYANALRVKAHIYKDRKDYAQAEKIMLDCIAIREKTEGKLTLSNEQFVMAGIYMKSGKLDKAIGLLNDGLAFRNTTNNRSGNKTKAGLEVDALKISYYRTLASCYQLKGDTKNYEETLEKMIVAKDAFYEANSVTAIAELQTKYEVQKKEKTIVEQKLNLTVKNYWLFGSALFAALIAIIVWLVFKNYRRRQSIKMQLALKEEKSIAAQSIIDAEEHERKRIAADLHDNIGAYASAILADVEKITDNSFEKNNASLQNLQQHSQEIINSLRDTIWVLNKENITITGISDRIKNYLNKLQPSYGHIQFHFNEEIKNDVRLSSQHALSIFRIVQEAIHNALKHSNALNINISLNSNENMVIKIEDDGNGIADKKSSVDGNGLLNMKARANEAGFKLTILSEHDKGTTVLLQPATTN